MPRAARTASIVGVLVTLTLELWATDPLRGRIRRASGEEREFTGWLGLAQVLGEATDRDEPPPAAAPVGA